MCCAGQIISVPFGCKLKNVSINLFHIFTSNNFGEHKKSNLTNQSATISQLQSGIDEQLNKSKSMQTNVWIDIDGINDNENKSFK